MAGKCTRPPCTCVFALCALSPTGAPFGSGSSASATDNRDDSVLLALIDEFADDGLRFDSALDFCPELLVKPGILTRRAADRTRRSRHRVRLGAGPQEMGELDVGQSVAVKEKSRPRRRGDRGHRPGHRPRRRTVQSGGFVVVKVAKPQQDMRFDVPTVGLLDDRDDPHAPAAACWRSRRARPFFSMKRKRSRWRIGMD